MMGVFFFLYVLLREWRSWVLVTARRGGRRICTARPRGSTRRRPLAPLAGPGRAPASTGCTRRTSMCNVADATLAPSAPFVSLPPPPPPRPRAPAAATATPAVTRFRHPAQVSTEALSVPHRPARTGAS